MDYSWQCPNLTKSRYLFYLSRQEMQKCFLSCDFFFLTCEIYCKICKIAYISSSFASLYVWLCDIITSSPLPPLIYKAMLHFSGGGVRLVMLNLASGLPKLAHQRLNEIYFGNMMLMSLPSWWAYLKRHLRRKGDWNIQHNLKNNIKTILKEKIGKKQLPTYLPTYHLL